MVLKILAGLIILSVVGIYVFLLYTAVLAIQHTDATVNVLGGILIAILINGIGSNVRHNSKSVTTRK